MLGALSAGVSILGGLKGLFGKKPKQPSARENMVGQAQGAREAAEKYGFNPLTMLQYGQPGAIQGGGGAAPLASIQMLTDGLSGLDDIVSGDAERRRQADKFDLELRELQLEQARSGFSGVPPIAGGVGNGQSPLGRRAVTVNNGGASFGQRRGLSANGGASDLSKRDNPNANHPLRDSLGDVSSPDPTLDRGAGLFIGGVRLEPAPGWSSGEIFEQEYGDTPLSWPYSGAKMVADLRHNVGRFISERMAQEIRSAGGTVDKVDGKYYTTQTDLDKVKNQKASKRLDRLDAAGYGVHPYAMR